MGTHLPLRDKIANIIGVPNTDSWQIVDSQPETGLYLIHYTPDATMVRYGSVRGIVVDPDHNTIVARSYGYTPTALGQDLTIDEVDDQIHLVDASNPNVDFVLDPTTTLFRPGYDGKLLRVFYHSGHVYHSTGQRLDASQSRWGSSPDFMEIYNQLGGPADEELFDLSKRYSPYVHLFLLSDLSLQVASKSPGYLVYLGPRKMWEESPFPSEEVDWSLADLPTVSTPEEGRIYQPPYFSLEETNHFLNFGHFDPFDASELPERLLPGEFILAILMTPDGEETKGTIRIESPAYRWRRAMRDNNPDLYHQFFLLTNGRFIQAEHPNERELYLRKFPVVTPYELDDIRDLIDKDGPIIVWPQEEISPETFDRILASSDSRLYNIFLTYLVAVPPHQQENVLNFYQRYLDDVEDVIGWLISLNQRDDLSGESLPNRGKNLIGVARSFAQEEVNRGERINMREMANAYLERMILLEEAGNLYRIVKAMQNRDLP